METQETLKTPRTDDERHVSPTWHGDMLYYLSERDFVNNVWRYDLKTGKDEQVTFHKDFDAKNISAGGGNIVYEQGGRLHRLNPGTKESTPIEIMVRGDLNWARPRFATISANQLSNARLSPTGTRAVFEARGEIITVPKEHGAFRNITQSSHAADRAPVWSPDGQQIAWFSDESGEYQLMIGDQEGLTKPKAYPIPNKKFYFRPEWSPDGKHIAFTDTDYNCWILSLNNGVLSLVDTDRYAHPDRSLNPVWSPDSRFIAYARQMDNMFKAIMVYSLEEKKSYAISDALSDAIDPQWDANGKYLYFLASTDFGLNTGWLDMSSYNMPVTRALYMAVLAKDTPHPFAPLSDEEPLANGKSEEKKEDNGKVQIDWNGIQQRIIAIDVPVKNYTGTVAAPENHIFYIENPSDQPAKLHRYSIKDRKSVEFLPGVNYATISNDRKQLLYRSGSTWGIVSATGGPVKSGDGRINTSDIRIKVDPKEEYLQIYKEGWRFQRDFLYVDNVHGAPWDDIYEWYLPWVDHVRHRSDMNYIIDILGGEVAVGHSYTSGGDFPSVDNVSVGLLGADYEKINGFYRIKKIYTGESWNPNLRAPLSGPGMDVREGDYLIEVNGVPLTADMNLFALFENTVNKPLKIKVNNTPVLSSARSITVVPIANEGGLRTIDWVESNRRKVDELSQGQLAYVYVPNTSNPGYTSFNRYYFSQQDKKGAVIDERNNGGGSAADYMVDIMNRRLMGYFNSRANDRKPFTTPMAGIWGPKVMIINENAGSGGDLLPYMFRFLDIGPLVGTRTWGGLVGTWDTPSFIDGGRMVAPRGGFIDVDGEWAVEAEGVAPDIEVFQDPAAVIRGEDPQLEAAVKEALRLIPIQGIELKPEPPAPIRYKRAGN
jgi:tricorn protease